MLWCAVRNFVLTVFSPRSEAYSASRSAEGRNGSVCVFLTGSTETKGEDNNEVALFFVASFMGEVF